MCVIGGAAAGCAAASMYAYATKPTPLERVVAATRAGPANFRGVFHEDGAQSVVEYDGTVESLQRALARRSPRTSFTMRVPGMADVVAAETVMCTKEGFDRLGLDRVKEATIVRDRTAELVMKNKGPYAESFSVVTDVSDPSMLR